MVTKTTNSRCSRDFCKYEIRWRAEEDLKGHVKGVRLLSHGLCFFPGKEVLRSFEWEVEQLFIKSSKTEGGKLHPYWAENMEIPAINLKVKSVVYNCSLYLLTVSSAMLQEHEPFRYCRVQNSNKCNNILLCIMRDILFLCVTIFYLFYSTSLGRAGKPAFQCEVYTRCIRCLWKIKRDLDLK